MKKIVFVCLVMLSIASISGEANATSYTKLIDASLTGRVGAWLNMGKGYAFQKDGDGAGPVDIGTFNVLSSIFAGENKPTDVSLSFMYDINTHAITTSSVNVYHNNSVLLSLNYLNSGTVDITPKTGNEGQFELSGIFSVTGGSLANSVSNQLLASFSYNTTAFYNVADIHLTNGYFTLSAANPSNQIPEPATSVLLLSSLAGFAARRRKAKGIEV